MPQHRVGLAYANGGDHEGSQKPYITVFYYFYCPPLFFASHCSTSTIAPLPNLLPIVFTTFTSFFTISLTLILILIAFPHYCCCLSHLFPLFLAVVVVLEGLGTIGLPHLTLGLCGNGIGGVGHYWPPSPHMPTLTTSPLSFSFRCFSQYSAP